MSTQRHGFWKLATVAISLSHSFGVSALAFPQPDGTEVVPTATTAPEPFPYETVILTEDDVQEHPEIVFDDEVYADPDTINTISERGSSKQCKVIPSDRNWPSDLAWGVVNLFTLGGLIRTVPLAAPCYNGPHYNAAECASIAANWTDSDLQYVFFCPFSISLFSRF